LKLKWGFSIKKTMMALISGISGSVAILKIFYLKQWSSGLWSVTNFHINMILGNQKVSNEHAT
jgi:hypothetical protein